MRALLVYNAFSGLNNKVSRNIDLIISELLDVMDVIPFESTAPKSIISKIITDGSNYDMIVVVGGDGTVHEVINGVMALEKRPTVAIIPTGTCNDAARSLGMKNSIKKNLKIIKENNQTSLDISHINGEYFIYALATGTLTEISYLAPRKSKSIFGKLAYYLYVLNVLKNTKSVNINFNSKEKKLSGEYSLFLATNTRYLAGFKLKRLKKVCLNDGKLQIVLIKNTIKLFDIIKIGSLLAFGEVKSKSIIAFDSSDLEITSNDELDYNFDGELLSHKNKIHVNVIHKAINVVAEKKTIKKYFK